MENSGSSISEQLAVAFAGDVTVPESVRRMGDALLMDLAGICVAARLWVFFGRAFGFAIAVRIY